MLLGHRPALETTFLTPLDVRLPREAVNSALSPAEDGALRASLLALPVSCPLILVCVFVCLLAHSFIHSPSWSTRGLVRMPHARREQGTSCPRSFTPWQVHSVSAVTITVVNSFLRLKGKLWAISSQPPVSVKKKKKTKKIFFIGILLLYHVVFSSVQSLSRV